MFGKQPISADPQRTDLFSQILAMVKKDIYEMGIWACPGGKSDSILVCVPCARPRAHHGHKKFSSVSFTHTVHCSGRVTSCLAVLQDTASGRQLESKRKGFQVDIRLPRSRADGHESFSLRFNAVGRPARPARPGGHDDHDVPAAE